MVHKKTFHYDPMTVPDFHWPHEVSYAPALLKDNSWSLSDGTTGGQTGSGDTHFLPYHALRCHPPLRFMAPVHEPHHKYHYQPAERHRDSMPALLREMKKMGVNPHYYAMDRYFAREALLDENAMNASHRPRLGPNGWHHW